MCMLFFMICFLFISLTVQEDRDNFLSTALDEYKRCLVIGDKYDVRVVCIACCFIILCFLLRQSSLDLFLVGWGRSRDEVI